MHANSTESTAEPIGLATMSAALHTAHNYHDWHHEWIAPFIKGRVLDIGSGNGNHLYGLEDSELVSVDIDAACTASLREKYRSRSRWRFETIDVSQPGALARAGLGEFDTVFSSNVIEHIRDDLPVLRESVSILKPGGRLVLVLPALPSLFGRMDELAGHYRRYNKAMLRERFESLGVKKLQLRYVNAFGAFGWWLNGRVMKPKNLSTDAINSQIEVFDKYFVPVLRRIERGHSMPFGQSIVAVAEKV